MFKVEQLFFWVVPASKTNLLCEFPLNFVTIVLLASIKYLPVPGRIFTRYC